MKTVFLSLLVLFIAVCGNAAEADPVVGNWRWNNKNRIEIHADGTVGSPWGAGAWKQIPTSAVERKYQITWDVHATVDTFILSDNHKRLDGKNNRGQIFSAVRVD
jgi:hypothetical protein